MKLRFLLIPLVLSACGAPKTSNEMSPATSWPAGEIIDLSYAYNDQTVYWPTAEGFIKTTDFEGMTENGYWYTAYSFSSAEHGGTHLDAPVLLRTGFGAFWPDRERYMGTDDRGADAVKKLHSPGLDPAAVDWLTENRSIHALGIDTPSIDRGQSSLFESHRKLFAANIPAFENVANMEQLPDQDFLVIALPMKIEGGSGGPLSIVAIVSN